MKSLLAKILLALIASMVLALLVVTALSRATLQHGFEQFLEQQEERQIRNLIPELVKLYQRLGNWNDLADDPRRWMRLLALTRPEGVRPPDDAPPEFLHRPQHLPQRMIERESLRQGARNLWRRMFLLDAQREWVAGARYGVRDATRLVAIEVDGATVGWVGFRTADPALAPEARRFLQYQGRALLLSLLIALVLASAVGYLLARSLSRPVARLRDTVQELTRGQFSARATFESQDEIGDLARHVNRLAETLERNETARRRWTADIAHELRTPLAVLQGELEAVRDGLRPINTATVDSLHEEVVHLTELVDDLQTLALADAGALNLRLQTVDLAGLARQVFDGFTERIAAAGLQSETSLPERLDILADPQRLRQLLHNLLENACRYTESGGKLRLTLTAGKDSALMDIEDTAPGVEAAHREQLFDRFYRLEPSRGRARGGSGLGLAICRNIVAAHGGQITAGESKLGGLLIHVSLPLKV